MRTSRMAAWVQLLGPTVYFHAQVAIMGMMAAPLLFAEVPVLALMSLADVLPTTTRGSYWPLKANRVNT